MVCTSTYTITQADIDGAGFHLDVGAIGGDPLGVPVAVGAGFEVTLTGIVPDDGSTDPTDPVPTVEPTVTEQPLALTGAETRTVAGGALVALVLGAGLVLATRRRRSTAI